ncbi:MAG: hypothetical protein JWP86_3295, partial [Phenylobacterium sp.]|nr:hypothetical protein [Phenylobacterium sp.]
HETPGSVSGDAVQVGRTWQYVNVKGGPDRRYSNNPMLAIMLYGVVELSTPQGLNWQVQVLRADAAQPIASILLTVPPVGQRPGHVQSHCVKDEPIPQASPPVRARSRPRGKSTSGIKRALLTRTRTAYSTEDQLFTAIDLETTGLDAESDKIVELGLVKFRPDGTVVDEFATLVNSPGSSPEARAHHEISDADLVGAPSIDQVLPEVFGFISGTVLVAHNMEFEESFLSAVAKSTKLRLPETIGVCTLQTARRQLDGRAYSLISMYKTATGQWAANMHTALGDARSVREVFLWLLRDAPQPLYLTQPPPKTSPAPTGFDTCPISCRPMPLLKASVAELLASFPQSDTPRCGDEKAIGRYRELLTDCVEDGRLTMKEASALSAQARLTRLTGTQLRQLHQAAWTSAFSEEASADWSRLTPLRRREMFLLAEALGLDALAEKIKKVIDACAEPEPSPEARYLRGLRVGIVGDDSDSVSLRERAESYGAKIAVNITKTVQWLATTSPDAVDTCHNAARRLGIPMLSPREARVRLDEAIREAEFKAFERQRELDEWAAHRKQQDDYWRPTWRPVELDHDPEPDYDL